MDEEAKDEKTIGPELAPMALGNQRPGDGHGQNDGGLPKHSNTRQTRNLDLTKEPLDYRRGIKKGAKQRISNQAPITRPATRQAYKPKPPFRAVEGVGSEAWNRLDMGAIGLLMKFYEMFNGYNRFNLSVTYRMVKGKMSSLIFSRWIWQLIGYGFLDVQRWGRLQRNCSIYGLSGRWRSLSENPNRLDEIQRLLREIERLKKLPGDSAKREVLVALRKRICTYRSLKG